MVRELREEDAEAIVAERDRAGRFASLVDLAASVALRRNAIENLLRGAFDHVEDGRRRGLMFALDHTPDAALWLRRAKSVKRLARLRRFHGL